MKLPVKGLERLVDEDVRTATHGAYFDKEQETLSISNGHYLVTLRVEDCGDDQCSGIIPKEILKAASQDGLQVHMRKRDGVKYAVAHNGIEMPCIDAEYFKYEKFLYQKFTHRVAFSFGYLKLLGDVLIDKKSKTQYLEIQFNPEPMSNGSEDVFTTTKACLLDVKNDNLEADIVLMPMRM